MKGLQPWARGFQPHQRNLAYHPTSYSPLGRQRVISAYTSQVHKFRQSPRESTTPSIQAAMAKCEDA